MKQSLFITLFVFAFLFSGTSQKAELLHFKVEAGHYQRINTPVSVNLDAISISDTLSFQLFEKTKGQMVEKPCQVEPGYSPLLWFILERTTESGKQREYFLFRNEKAKIQSVVATGLTKEAIVLRKDSSDILHYQKAVMYPPAGADTSYKRSGFIHPLISPAGNILTRVSPPDHYHHVGIWNPWTKVKIGNHVTDFWNLNEKQGTVRFAGINLTVNGPVYGGFSVKQEHIDFQGAKSEELAINEVWDVRAWNCLFLSPGKQGTS